MPLDRPQNLFVQLHSCVAQESCKLTSVRPNAAPLQTNLNLRSRISQSLGAQNSWWIWIRQKPTNNEVTIAEGKLPKNRTPIGNSLPAGGLGDRMHA